jgi:hypothetical protein
MHEGCQALQTWLRSFGTITYGRHRVRRIRRRTDAVLRAAGVTVVEANRPHPHTRSRRGKTDAIDAEAAARKVLSDDARLVQKEHHRRCGGDCQRQVARQSAVKARGAVLCQLRRLLNAAPEAVQETVLAQCKTLQARRRCAPDCCPDRLSMPYR